MRRFEYSCYRHHWPVQFYFDTFEEALIAAAADYANGEAWFESIKDTETGQEWVRPELQELVYNKAEELDL